MKITWPEIALIVFCCAVLGFELWHFRSGSAASDQRSRSTTRKNEVDFSLLPAGEIQTWSEHFAPGSHAESWEPTLGDMNNVEADLAQITTLSRTDPDNNRQIDDPREYFRQYLALQIDGRKKMLLNAICSVNGDANWRKHLVVVRDGGKCFWHAMYDLSTRTFSDLSVNGKP